MRRMLLTSGILAACLVGPGELNAQSNRYGCTLGLPEIVEAGLDRAVARACTRHDQCWRVQGTCGGWNPGFAHKAQCDLAFYGDLNAVCTLTAAFLRIAGEPPAEVTEFLEDCSEAATAAYVGVSAALRIFARNQCNACNSRMCDWLRRPLPPSCCDNDPRCCEDDCPPEPPNGPIVTSGDGG